MTVALYERLTLDYRGPYLPIFCSRTEYLDDEQYVYEGFDFAITKNHHYKAVPFYFLIPAFLLSRPWPTEREWLWHPAVKVSKATMRDLLRLEDEYGGWRRNRRGHPQIPRLTGQSGKSTLIQPGEGWASLGLESNPLSIHEQQELFQ